MELVAVERASEVAVERSSAAVVAVERSSEEVVAVERGIGTMAVGSLETFRERLPCIGTKRQPPERLFLELPLTEYLTSRYWLNGQV